MSKNGAVETSTSITQARPSTQTHHHFLAGLLTGSFSSLLLQPADLLKTRLQQSPDRTTLLPTLRGILARPNGVRNLWRGTLPSVIRTGVGSALYFSSLNALRTRVAASSSSPTNLPAVNRHGESSGATISLGDRPSASSSSILPTLTKSQNLVTGAMARAWAGFIMMPITVLKVRYESSLYAYPSLLAASRDVFRREGLRGFFAGYGATAVRDAPYAGLYVVFYESCKEYLGRLSTSPGNSQKGTTGDTTTVTTINPTRSMPINFLSGALAATAATTVTNPFDAVKTRLQLMPGRYGNMFRAGIMMVRGEGVRSLFDGLGLRVGRKAISSALAWTGYEEVVRRVGNGAGVSGRP